MKQFRFQTCPLPTFRKCCCSALSQSPPRRSLCTLRRVHGLPCFSFVYLETDYASGLNFNGLSFFKPSLLQTQEQSVHRNTLPTLIEQIRPFLTLLKRQPPLNHGLFLQQANVLRTQTSVTSKTIHSNTQHSNAQNALCTTVTTASANTLQCLRMAEEPTGSVK